MPGGLKFRIHEVEGLYYPCSKNKGADQLRGYREADLRLCFRICKKPVFSRRGSINSVAFAPIKDSDQPRLRVFAVHMQKALIGLELASECTRAGYRSIFSIRYVYRYKMIYIRYII